MATGYKTWYLVDLIALTLWPAALMLRVIKSIQIPSVHALTTYYLPSNIDTKLGYDNAPTHLDKHGKFSSSLPSNVGHFTGSNSPPLSVLTVARLLSLQIIHDFLNEAYLTSLQCIQLLIFMHITCTLLVFSLAGPAPHVLRRT